MCLLFPYKPLIIPTRTINPDDDTKLGDAALGLMAAVGYTNGIHSPSLQYPLKQWVDDPNFVHGHRDRAIHLAPPEADKRVELSS